MGYETRTPAAPEAEPQRRTVPVAFAADRASAPVLYVAVRSLLDCAAPENDYEIHVLHTDLDGGTQALFRSTLEGPNVRCTFRDMTERLAGLAPGRSGRITAGTYLRFLVPELLGQYPRVICLDRDVVVRRDVSALLDVELGECAVAAAQDPDLIAGAFRPDGETRSYLRDVLGVEDPLDCLQPGVLVLDTERCRRALPPEKWMQYAADARLRQPGRDILNMVFAGKTKHLDPRWNVLFDHAFTRRRAMMEDTPAPLLAAFEAARDDPWIVHYAGSVKPWQAPGQDMGWLFWNAARRTPYDAQLRAGLEKASSRASCPGDLIRRKAELDDRTAALQQEKDRLEDLYNSRGRRIRELEDRLAQPEQHRGPFRRRKD